MIQRTILKVVGWGSLIFSLGLVGCARSGEKPQVGLPHAVEPGSAWKKWQHKKPPVEMDYPAEWQVEEVKPSAGGPVFQVTFAKSDGNSFTLTAALVPEGLPQTTDERKQALHAQAQGRLTRAEADWAEQEPESQWVSGNSGLKSTFTFTENGQPQRGFRVTIPMQKHYYLIEAVARAEEAEALQPIYEKMMKSMVLGD